MRKALTRLTIFVAFAVGFVVAIVVMSLLTQGDMSTARAEADSTATVVRNQSLEALCDASAMISDKQFTQAKKALQEIIADGTETDQAKIAAAQLELLEQVQARAVLD